MTWCIIISLLLVVLFVGATIWRTRELPESISAMVYSLPKGGAQWLWTMWLWAVGITTFVPVIGIMDWMGLGVLPFAALVCIMLTGAWPLFQQQTKRWHYVSARLCGVISQVCVVVMNRYMALLWLLYMAFSASTLFKPSLVRKEVLVMECICYAALVGAVITLKVG